MPSKTKKQARFMRAVAHGFKPDRVEGPTRAVAREFMNADKKKVKKAMGGSVAPLGMTARAPKTARPGMGRPVRGVGNFGNPLNVADRSLADAQNRLQAIPKRPSGGVQMFAKGGLTRKHFKSIADIMKSHIDAGKAAGAKDPVAKKIAKDMADYLQTTNERFDRNRFMSASGADED
jgi:hypothetical protein